MLYSNIIQLLILQTDSIFVIITYNRYVTCRNIDETNRIWMERNRKEKNRLYKIRIVVFVCRNHGIDEHYSVKLLHNITK